MRAEIIARQYAHLEVWRMHPELTDYEVSNHGRVRRLTARTNTTAGRILRPHLNKDGYRVTRIAGKERRIHILVLETFIGKRPEGHWACHADDRKENNRLSNLRWAMYAENYKDWVKNGGGRHGAKAYCAKLSEADVIAIRAQYARGGISYRQLAKEYGVDHSTIGYAVKAATWKHI